MERVAGIEPASSAWKAEVLPLNYTRDPRDHCVPSFETRSASTNAANEPPHPASPAVALTRFNSSGKPNRTTTNTDFSITYGGGGWIRTTEARASDLQSDPFGHSGTPPEGRTFSRSGPPVSTGLEGEFFASDDTRKLGLPLRLRQLPNSFYDRVKWSWREESNPRPADYKSAALPLSYTSNAQMIG